MVASDSGVLEVGDDVEKYLVRVDFDEGEEGVRGYDTEELRVMLLDTIEFSLQAASIVAEEFLQLLSFN